MARANTKMSITREDKGIFRMDFANGESREFHLTHNHPLLGQFAALGLESKLRNRITESKTVEEAVEAIDEQLAAFAEGKYNVSRNGDGTSATYGLLTQALAALSGKGLEETQEFVASLDKKTQAAMRADPTVAAKIESLKPKAPAKEVPAVADALAAFLSK